MISTVELRSNGQDRKLLYKMLDIFRDLLELV